MYKNILKTLLILVLLLTTFAPCEAKDKDKEKNKKPTMEEIEASLHLDPANYELVKYNSPAGTKELNLFGLKNKGQYNLNSVASPDFHYVTYSEVYLYPQTGMTSSAMFIIQLDASKNNKQALMEASTLDKELDAIISSDMTSAIPYKFNTFTPVDWNETSDKILIKEKAGKNFDQVYFTKLYVYDVPTQSLTELDSVRKAIIYFWKNRGTYLEELKWDIKPLGWDKLNPNRVTVLAYGYEGRIRKFLGAWSIDVQNKRTILLSLQNEKFNIAENGVCLKFNHPPDRDYSKYEQEDIYHKPVSEGGEPLKEVGKP